jgi:protein-S-isoprenylcysteine O-methyltransferase Ste14
MPKAQVILITLLATFAYLTLAIWGWGGVAAFFAEPARIALTIVLFALSAAALFTEGNLSSGEREDRANRWVLGVFTVIGILSAYVPAYAERHEIWTFGGDGLRWLGVLLFAAGGALRIWPVFVLGRRFSGLVAIQKDHELVTTGIYSRIRNPSYLGLLISSFGWALAFRSSIGLILVAALIPPLLARIISEEKLLREQFGAEYDAYRARTSRLIPGIY